jgi:GT2 family glycosyltransferase
MRISVAIATTGRARELADVIDRLADQTRKPDFVLVVATAASDVFGIEVARIRPYILLADKGLCKQRNAALEFLGTDYDVVIFFDDDFVPANDFIAEVERTMESDPSIVGVTGNLVDDGIHGAPIRFNDAVRRLDVEGERPGGVMRDRSALYGCNMAISIAAADGLKFDEALPLYGWQEDVDFTIRLAARGRLVSGPQVTGIHLGARGARSSGRRLGYSQIANPVHLWRKGTLQGGLGWRLLMQNLAANMVRSIRPEPHIDRRGRLQGNLLALADLLLGKIDPMKVERL